MHTETDANQSEYKTMLHVIFFKHAARAQKVFISWRGRFTLTLKLRSLNLLRYF